MGKTEPRPYNAGQLRAIQKEWHHGGRMNLLARCAVGILCTGAPFEAVPLGGPFIGPSWPTREGGSFVCRGAGTNASWDREEVPTKQGLVWEGLFFPLPYRFLAISTPSG